MINNISYSDRDRASYGYNDRSEVTSANSSLDEKNYNYGYEFDPIGNRLTSTSKETGTPVTRNYTSNVLNQYTAIDNPTATPSYDDDGNMTALPVSTGTWACTWDAENRLIAMEKADKKLEFKYDYASRRVEKKVFTWDTDHWTLDSHLRFVYDGFLQIEKLNGAAENALLITRIWTGVEGYDRLISETTHTGATNVTYYALCDANKNITDYLNSTGAIAGHFEFSPFGQITRASGTAPDDFDFRFSSEFFEQETGLVYYNFRYYSPELGRWVSRDPIGERGGKHLYRFCYNSSMEWLDYLGRDPRQTSSELKLQEEIKTLLLDDNPISGGTIGGDESPRTPEPEPSGFVVILRDVEPGSLGRDILRKLGLRHADMIGPDGKIIRAGVGGGTDIDTDGDGIIDIDSRSVKRKIKKFIVLNRRFDGCLRAGDAATKCCADATDADIESCIKDIPAGAIFDPLVANCQHDIQFAIDNCCLTGYKAIGVPPTWYGDLEERLAEHLKRKRHRIY